jgi:polar amino acid transport system substrate-binding protein
MSKLRTLTLGLLGFGLAAILLAPLAASAQTLARIKNAGTLNLGFVEGAAPLSSLGSDGKPVGYSIDLCQAIAADVKARLGQPELALKFTALKVDAAIDRGAKGEVDLLCTATVDTLKRRERMSYSIQVLNGGIGALLRRDAAASLRDALNGKTVRTGPVWRASINGGLSNRTYAVRAGTVSQEWAREQTRQLGVNVKVITVDDDAKGIQLVRARLADAYFGERVLLDELLAREKGSNELVLLDRQFNPERMGLAMGRNDDDFRLLVDTALSRLFRSKEFAALHERHFGPLDEAGSKQFIGFALP